MRLRALTWNIGGGKLLTPGADPNRLASYGRDGLEEIAAFIKQSGADVVALQEAQQCDGHDQVETIARLAGYDYYFYDAASESHIDKGSTLGNGILSKYPISEHAFRQFINPNVRVTLEDGSTMATHDKGSSSCAISVDGQRIAVATLHLTPFRKFGIMPESELAQTVLSDVSSKLCTTSEHALIMGDFNIDDSHIAAYMPELFKTCRMDEIALDEPTTPKGRHYDHVLFRGMRLASKTIRNDVLTDHYPVICDFR